MGLRGKDLPEADRKQLANYAHLFSQSRMAFYISAPIILIAGLLSHKDPTNVPIAKIRRGSVLFNFVQIPIMLYSGTKMRTLSNVLGERHYGHLSNDQLKEAIAFQQHTKKL